jgi:DNA invertase Pin-like site-specific DNA recombinase
MTTAKLRAATYSRVSTRHQDFAMQQHETRELAQRRGWTVELELADHAASGANPNRPALVELRAAARRRAFDVLVVYKLDRVFRSTRELLLLIDDLRELGIAFVSVHDSFDTSTPSGRFTLTILAAVAELEREFTRERTRSSLAEAKRRGKKLGRPRAAVDQELVRVMRRRGMTMPAIAKHFGVSERTLQRRAR